MRLAVPLALALLAAVVTRPAAAPVPKAAKRIDLYFPTTVGTKRVYANTVGGKPGGRTASTVTRAEENGGVWRVTTEEAYGLRPDGRAGLTTVVGHDVSAGGLWLTARGDADLGTPQPLLLSRPAWPGDSWAFGADGAPAPTEVGETPAGKFAAVAVTCTRGAGTGSASTEKMWLAVGVGRVKSVTTVGDKEMATSILMAFTPAKPAAGKK